MADQLDGAARLLTDTVDYEARGACALYSSERGYWRLPLARAPRRGDRTMYDVSGVLRLRAALHTLCTAAFV